MSLTKKQKTMLDFIDGFIKGCGYSPTFREIMQALGYKSVSTVAKHVDNLVTSGYLVKRDGAVRSLELADSDLTAPWWKQLVPEINRRQASDDEKLHKEADILKQALDILQK